MRRQDDGDAGFPQLADHVPHAAAQFHVDAGRRFVEKQDFGFVRQRLCDQDPPFHAAGQRDDLGILPVPQGQVAENALNDCRGGFPPEKPTAETYRVPDRLECVGGQFLGYQSDHCPRLAVIAHNVETARGHAAGGRVHDAADDTDQRCLAGAVGSEQCEDFAALDDEVDVRQRGEPARVGLRKSGNGDGGA